MKVKTTRFSELEVDAADVINFTEGPLGFETLKKFFLVDPGDQTLILWLQSIEDGAVAFPVIEPNIFNPDYSVQLLPAELASLNLESSQKATVYVILTIPQNITDMSANLKAPVIINNETRMARQIVLQDNKLEVKFKMYTDLKRYIVSYASDDRKRVQKTINATQADSANIQNTTASVSKAIRPEKPTTTEL